MEGIVINWVIILHLVDEIGKALSIFRIVQQHVEDWVSFHHIPHPTQQLFLRKDQYIQIYILYSFNTLDVCHLPLGLRLLVFCNYMLFHEQCQPSQSLHIWVLFFLHQKMITRSLTSFYWILEGRSLYSRENSTICSHKVGSLSSLSNERVSPSNMCLLLI